MAEPGSGPLIDVHSHLYLDWYLDELRSRTEVPCVSTNGVDERLVVIPETTGVPLTPAYWSADEKIRYMDRAGIEVSLVSPGNPWLGFLDDARGPEWAGRINLEFAALAEASAGRLVALGVLPMSSIDDCIRATAAVGDHPTIKGFIHGTEICGLPFDEPDLDPVWGALNEHHAVLLLHPGAAWLSSANNPLGLTVGVSFPLETTIAASRLLLADVPRRFPNIKFLLAHGGGALPFLLGRLDHVWGATPPPSTSARAFYADALVYSEQTTDFVSERLGADRLMWGSDHPFSEPDASQLGSVRGSIRGATARSMLGL